MRYKLWVKVYCDAGIIEGVATKIEEYNWEILVRPKDENSAGVSFGIPVAMIHSAHFVPFKEQEILLKNPEI
jgi:hypothetical protein